VNCKEVIDLIDAYLDGELDPVTNNNIEAHLRECSRCEQAFKDHHALISAIGTAAPYLNRRRLCVNGFKSHCEVKFPTRRTIFSPKTARKTSESDDVRQHLSSSGPGTGWDLRLRFFWQCLSSGGWRLHGHGMDSNSSQPSSCRVTCAR